MAAKRNPAETAQIIDIKPLFRDDAAPRKTAVQALGCALEANGAFVAAGLPDGWDRERRTIALLDFFELSEAVKLAWQRAASAPTAGAATAAMCRP